MKKFKQISFSIICFQLVWSVIGLHVENEEFALERLKNHLFVNYNPLVRPGNKNEALLVEIDFELEHFTFFKSNGACDFVGVLRLFWYDPTLKWNPEVYHNLSSLSVDRNAVWLPDIELYNNEAHNFFEAHRNGYVLVENTGRLIWMDDVKARTFCTSSLKNWPNDKHTCKLNFGSWIHHAFLIDAKPLVSNHTLNLLSNAEVYNSHYKLTNFTITRVETKYNCCIEPYVSLNYHIEFERHTSFMSILSTFACCIILFNLIPMSLPPRRKEKIWLNCLSLILVVGHLIYFGNILSTIGDMPYIVVFHCASLILITGSLLFSVFSLFILRTQFSRNHLPWLIKRMLKNPLAKCLNIGITSKHMNDESQGHSKFVNVKLVEDENNLLNSGSNREYWILFVQLMERIMLITYIFVYLILASICFI